MLKFTSTAILIFIYICIASISAYTLWYYVLKNNSLSKMFIIKFAEPLFACIFGAIILGENIFNFVTDDGFLSGQLKSQGCNDGGAVFAKQFSVNDDLKALGTWYSYVNMQVGDKVEVQFTTPTDIIIRKI